MFIDEVTILIQSGDGGDGCCSFRREKYVPLGGPDGGDGGDGGSVIFEADIHLSTLTELKNNRLYRAKSGSSGKGQTMTGKSGKDLIIKVPAGTLIRNQKNLDLLADLTEHKVQFVAARGGKGGRAVREPGRGMVHTQCSRYCAAPSKNFNFYTKIIKF